MKILLFGATGNVGYAISNELKHRNYEVTAVIRNQTKVQKLKSSVDGIIIADVTIPSTLTGICEGFDVIISALGKSVSPSDKSKPTFNDIDYVANSNILAEAKKSKTKKFVYISAFHSERYLHLEYFRVHQKFSDELVASGIDYSIIKPPAVFSAFKDMIAMAKKGQLVNIGSGDKKTNPIYEGDLAKIVADTMSTPNSVIEAGGKNIYTRKQLNEIIQSIVEPGKPVRKIPLGMFKIMLPLVKIFDRNMYDKFAFFVEVLRHDTIAPQLGNMTFEDYIKVYKNEA